MSGLGFVARTFKMSLTDISKELGVTSQTVNDWVKGKRKIPKKRLEQLELVFDLPEEYLVKSEKDLNEVERLEIQMKYLKSINEIKYDKKYPYWSHQKQITKLQKEIEEKKMLVRIEELFAGGTRLEDEDYNPRNVRNYMLFEKMVNLLAHEDDNPEQVEQLSNLLLGEKHTRILKNSESMSRVIKRDMEADN